MRFSFGRGLSLASVSSLFVALYSATLPAQEVVVQFDPVKTQVAFTLGDVLHTVHGEFKLKRGEIRFDPSTGAASGSIVIDATSGNSGSNARDGRMHKNILESKKYPEITFTAHHVKGQLPASGEAQLEVEGTFNIHGADHPLTLAAKVKANGGILDVQTHFQVPYVKWGMKNPSTFLLRVNDTVDIDIHGNARVQGPTGS